MQAGGIPPLLVGEKDDNVGLICISLWHIFIFPIDYGKSKKVLKRNGVCDIPFCSGLAVFILEDFRMVVKWKIQIGELGIKAFRTLCTQFPGAS